MFTVACKFPAIYSFTVAGNEKQKCLTTFFAASNLISKIIPQKHIKHYNKTILFHQFRIDEMYLFLCLSHAVIINV